MAGVIFFYQNNGNDIFSGRQSDLLAWNNAIKLAGDVDRLIVINKTKQEIKSPDRALRQFEVVDEFPSVEGNVVGVVCPWDNVNGVRMPLWEFDHQVDWYAFGPSGGWGVADFKCGIYVPQSGFGAMHAVHVSSIVMAHRYWMIGRFKR